MRAHSERVTWFDGFVRDHHEAVLRYAVRRCASRADAEDVVAETFLIAWRRPREAADGGLPWLYRTAANTLRNMARGQHRRTRLARRTIKNAETPEPTSRPDEGVITRAVVATALDRLRPGDREVLTLSAWEGLTDAELGVALDCTPGAARVRLHRARARLRQALADLGITTFDEVYTP